jgi:hypothetical protein
MATGQEGDALTEDHRRAIFLALVQAQDRGSPVAESRLAMADQFGLTSKQVEAIEREGLDGNWPPLGD